MWSSRATWRLGTLSLRRARSGWRRRGGGLATPDSTYTNLQLQCRKVSHFECRVSGLAFGKLGLFFCALKLRASTLCCGRRSVNLCMCVWFVCVLCVFVWQLRSEFTSRCRPLCNKIFTQGKKAGINSVLKNLIFAVVQLSVESSWKISQFCWVKSSISCWI